LEWIANDDPKIKGADADKLKAALDEFAADFA
jgi:F-type H+-transporting ATPase subunit alpha